MGRHEAVDRLMALATEEPAARPAERASAGRGVREIDAGARSMSRLKASAPSEPGSETTTSGAARPRSSAATGGRQVLKTIVPLLPALGGLMQLVDHGAMQAAARVLLLLGSKAGSANGAADQAALSAEQRRYALAQEEMRAWQQAVRKEMEALSLQVAAADELLTRTRAQLRRLNTDQLTRENELRSLGERVRLLSAGLIILMLLILAQMILLLVMVHK